MRSAATCLDRGDQFALLGGIGDALIDLYVNGREECIAVQAAYERWRDAPQSVCGPMFAAYRAALDREGRASAVSAELVGRVARSATGSG
jgi:hypothetical protein